MKNSLVALFFLHFCAIFSMNNIDDSDKALKLRVVSKKENSEYPMYKSPTILITTHAKHPDFIFSELKKYPVQDLFNFHYAQYNNLLHCLVEGLVDKKDSVENFAQLINDYKRIFKWLVSIGFNINEVNDHHNTPLVLAYSAEDHSVQPLINFLEHDLQAKTTYFSLAPEMRFCKNVLWEFFTCQWCKQKHS